MATWKMPPKAKVYEALTAVADKRVTIIGALRAEVTSSSRNKTYLVEWSDDLRYVTANDNASYWQGYIGYPIIAALLSLGALTFSDDTARRLSGIPWNHLNTRYKRNYESVVEYVLQEVEAKGGNRNAVARDVDDIYRRLEDMDLRRLPRRRRPPRESA
jgi:hypothetical protein